MTIRVTFNALTVLDFNYITGVGGFPAPPPRDIDADDVSLYEGWAVFQKYVPIEGEKFKDSVFVEAIRLDKIDSIKRVDRIPEDAHP